MGNNHYTLPTEGYIRLPQVKAVTGLSRSTIYNYIQQGKFPAPKRIGARISVWEVVHIRAFLKTGTWGGA